jgi:hypothetical protein
MGSGKRVIDVDPATDTEIMGDCRYCKGTGRKLDRSTQRRANDAGYYHDEDCECATCQLNDHLGYDADVSDSSQYCKHGTFIGSWWGPDYMCGKCEDGVAVCEDCGKEMYPGGLYGDDIPEGYDYLTSDNPQKLGRYSEQWHATLCRDCESIRNADLANRFRLMDACALAAQLGHDTIVLHELAKTDVMQALAVADRMGWVR